MTWRGRSVNADDSINNNLSTAMTRRGRGVAATNSVCLTMFLAEPRR